MAEIIKSYLTKNPCYNSIRTITPKGLMLHSVGVNQPRAQVFIDTWNDPDYKRACVHAFIDALDGKIYQTLPWAKRAWHCGGSGNNTHIGVEMCEPSGIAYTRGSSKFKVVGDRDVVLQQVRRTYKSAVYLFARLCQIYNLDPEEPGTILSHHEGFKHGIATNHGDPEHLWKGTGSQYTMGEFRSDVAAQLWALRQNGSKKPDVVPGEFKVEVMIDDLWVRMTPSMADNRNPNQPSTGKGVFTITETQGQFGKLKSGAGWINLDNPGVKRL